MAQADGNCKLSCREDSTRIGFKSIHRYSFYLKKKNIKVI